MQNRSRAILGLTLPQNWTQQASSDRSCTELIDETSNRDHFRLLDLAKTKSQAPVLRRVCGWREMPEYSLDEVSMHCTEESCWIVVDDKVYDVTKFVSEHPGGRRPLLAFAGEDATDAIKAQQSHNLVREGIKKRLATCYIGDVKLEDRSYMRKAGKGTKK